MHYAETQLGLLGANTVNLRLAEKKDGPVITESGNFILDCNFSEIGSDLESKIKNLTGVIESGLFWEYNPEILSN